MLGEGIVTEVVHLPWQWMGSPENWMAMGQAMSIVENYRQIRETVPENVTIVVATKMRTPEEITRVLEAGATDIGENYLQEGVRMRQSLGSKAHNATWHMIGHLQKNKISKALRTFDVIQTVDSTDSALAIDKRVEATGRNIVPVYIEINIGSEDSKAGISPKDHEPFEEYMEQFLHSISHLEHIRVEGLMTMGPRFGNPEDSRSYFRRIKQLFDKIAVLNVPNMKYLSMGMTNSYRVAIEEGSNMVRIGTAIFGERKSDRH